jgi:PAS domain S-box-containing protein
MRYTRQVVIFLVLLVLCGFLLYSSYTYIESKTIDQVNDEQAVHAQQAAAGIGNVFEVYNASLSFLADNEHIITLDEDGRDLMRDFYNNHIGEISAITRVDENGIIAYTYPVESSTGANISSQSHVREELGTHSVVISDVFTAVQGFRAVAFHVPVFDDTGYRGSIAILIPFDTLAQDNLGTIKILGSGYAWSVSKNGVVIYSPVPGQTGRTVFDLFNSSPTLISMARDAMNGSRGTAAYWTSEDPARDLPGMKYQASYLPVTMGNTRWSIIVSTPENEILGTIQGFRNNLIIFSALLILSLLFFTYYVTRAEGIMKEEEIRTKAEDALRESEEFNRSLVENLPDIILIYDKNGTITFANKTATTIMGRPSPGIIGQSALSFVADYQRDEIAQKMKERLSGAHLPPYEMDIRTGADKTVTVLLQAVPVSYRKEPGVLLLMTDITPRKQAEEKILEAHRDLEKKVAERTHELSEANIHLKELDRLKSAFLATMSHELRTPLNSIIGFTGILLQELAGPLNAEQKKQMGMVSDSAEHLLALINDVLDISKIEAGELRLLIEPVDIRLVLEKVGRAMKPLTNKKDLAFELYIAPDVGMVLGDARRVEQVVLNLMSNAVKFTDKGTVRIECSRTGDQVVIRVMDTGIGISREDMGKLFIPFSQVETGLSRQYEGTGLGLSICKRLVDLMEGTISVESEPGKGSTFIVTLPAEKRDS